MPRNHNAGPSALRNRNRVTNKTRLKVITDNIDADPIVLDEDEEKARVVSTAGVDAEDANEHHLQAVLSAAATRHQANSRSTRAASEKDKSTPAAYIPTPDSTGIVGNYEELYPPGRWKDPITYVKSSDTAEESISFTLANGFIYYMDERDKEWLDKNNEEARGEGTSAQGAVSGANARSSRSSKLKGKDPEVSQPVGMSEDEFELVMAIFEKVTHEKTEFLHHGLEQGAPFPPFSDYQDTFASELAPSMFAVFSVPSWVSPPPHLTRLARVIYPYWRERRSERGGHPIIPVVNLDETDTRNESYICFRRREIKAIRKTRAQQATYSDKMLRLQTELATALDLAKGVLHREGLKREGAVRGHAVWDQRFVLADLKRKHPSLGNKEDEELFHDKERPKKQRDTGRIPLKIRTPINGDLASPAPHVEPTIRPKERQAQIQSQIQQELARQKERDSRWEDVTDNPYQPTPAAHASKLFKFIAASRASSSASARASLDSETNKRLRAPRALRLRAGRGGRLHLDRRDATPLSLSPSDFFPDDEQGELGAQENARRHAEQWRYDADDGPAVGVEGVEEEDRMLVDDYDTKYLLHHMSLLSEQDFQSFVTDVSITTTSSDGRSQTHVPFRLGAPYRRDVAIARPGPSPLASGHGMATMQSGSPSVSLSSNGTPVAMTTQLKKMPPPTVPHMRISSNGGMRPPGLPTLPNMYPNVPPAPTSPHSTSPVTANGVNAQEETNGNLPPLSSPNGHVQVSADQNHPDANLSLPSSASPVRVKEQIPHSLAMPSVPNGYHISPVTQYSTPMANAQYVPANTRHNGMNLQQMQSLKSAFANMSPSSDATMPTNNPSMQIRSPATYMGPAIPPGQNYMQMAATRQIQQQWLAAQVARPASVNTAEVNGTDGLTAPALSSTLSGTPIRTPSANGMRASLSRSVAVPNVAHSLSPPQGRASPANAHIARLSGPMSPSPHLMGVSLAVSQAHSSPTRSPQPAMATPSPSLQARHAVGSAGVGY